METVEVTIELVPDKNKTKPAHYFDPSKGISSVDVAIERWLIKNCSGDWKFVCCRPGYDKWHSKLVYEFSDTNDATIFKAEWCKW